MSSYNGTGCRQILKLHLVPRAVESWHGPQGYIFLPGPINGPLGMGAVDIRVYMYIKHHKGGIYYSFVVSSCKWRKLKTDTDCGYDYVTLFYLHAMLRAKHGFAQSRDYPVQTLDP